MGQNASIQSRFTLSYIMAFVLIVGTTISTHLLVNYRLSMEQQAAEIVNVSGAQRMLSQRAYALAEALTLDPDDEMARDFMALTTSQFAQSHARLSQYVRNENFPGEIATQLDDVFFNPENGIDPLVVVYSQLASLALDRPLTDIELDRLESLALGELIDQLHTAVGLFQADAEAGLAAIDRIGIIGIGIVILVLLFEAMFIFVPLMKSLLRRMASEREAREKAEVALDMEKAALDSKERLMTTLHAEFVGPLEKAKQTLEALQDKADDTSGDKHRITRALERISEAHEKADFMISFYSRWKKDTPENEVSDEALTDRDAA